MFRSLNRSTYALPILLLLMPTLPKPVDASETVVQGPGTVDSSPLVHPRTHPSGQQIDAKTPLTVGDPIEVLWGDRWWRSVVQDVRADGSVGIHYVGYGHDQDEVVTRDRVRVLRASQDTAPKVGQPIEIFSGGTWYKGAVIGVENDGRVKVHYHGWSEQWNEVVGRDRIRVLSDVKSDYVAPQELSLKHLQGKRVAVHLAKDWTVHGVIEHMDGSSITLKNAEGRRLIVRMIANAVIELAD